MTGRWSVTACAHERAVDGRRAVLRIVEMKGYFLPPFAAAALAPFCFFVFAVFFGLLSPIVVLLFPANITADAKSSRKMAARHKRG